MTLADIKTAINREATLKENFDFILNHLTDPLFPEM
jgi:hypothetical protein